MYSNTSLQIDTFEIGDILAIEPELIFLKKNFTSVSFSIPRIIKPSGNMVGKRIFDAVFSFFGLLLLFPLLFLLIIWIKCDSPGPVFFRQTRVGRYGKLFEILKFRTMVEDADRIGKHFTVGDDPRITKIGKFLRKYKLDELPQLINVLLGQMSLVGPRPQVPQHVAEYPKNIKKIILAVPPGMTGFASLAYINESEMLKSIKNPERVYKEKIIPTKIKFYVYYVLNRNLWLDLKVILLTVCALCGLRLNPAQKVETLYRIYFNE